MQVFIDLFNLIFEPLEILLSHIGISEQTLSIGFGNIEWFNLEIVLILKLILAVLIVWFFTKFIYWFFRNIFNMITGWLK